MSVDGVTWRQHPGTLKWHAYRAGDERSACGYTTYKLPDGRQDVPAGACKICAGVLGVRPPDGPEVEEHVGEFVGGALDGVRLTLGIVRESATRWRVLAMTYETKFRVLTAREVERAPTPPGEEWRS